MQAAAPTPAARPALRRLLLFVVAVEAYGVANYLSGLVYLPGCTFAELRPQVVLPMFLGILWGGPAGFACGALGDMLGYAMAGKGLLFAPHWSLANGLMGLICGLAPRARARPVDSIPSFARLLVVLLAASSLPYIFSTGMEFAQGHVSLFDACFRLLLPVVITDTLWAFLLVPLLMYAAHLLVMRLETRTLITVHYLVMLTVLATWFSSVLVSIEEELRVEELYTLGALILLVLVVGLGVAAFSARKITAPVVTLTDLARRAAAGDYAPVAGLRDLGRRDDELGILAQAFATMVAAVARREEVLQQQVTELKIEIDHQKQREELARITGSDYFQQLKRKAGDLRRQAVVAVERQASA